MKLKILHVINSLTPGGAETLLVNSLAPGGLQEQADNIVVYFQGTSALEKRIDSRVKIICLNYKGILSLPFVLGKLTRIIKENNIDIVHSHLNPAGWYTKLACPRGIPQVHTVHTTYSMDKETHPLKLWFEKQLYFKRRDAHIILLSDYTREDFLKALPFKGRSFVLHNFVADAFFEKTASSYEAGRNDLRVVSAGRLNSGKNIDYLLNVFSHIKNEEIVLDWYGAGDKTAYEHFIKDNGLKIKLMGQQDNMAELLYTYDLFIMPSKFEGFPLSVFEAMAAGVPLMLSDIAPLKGIVNDNAIYFALNDPRSVADTLLNILEKKTDITAMATKAKAYAEQTVRRERYLHNLLEIYQQVLQQH
ncbi:MAG: glycosyltransferase [Ferruginibacter sp.]